MATLLHRVVFELWALHNCMTFFSTDEFVINGFVVLDGISAVSCM